MKIHHLNCACMCPVGGKLFPNVFPSKVICHCLLVESKSGLILVDTGFSKDVLENPDRMGFMNKFLGLQSSVEDSALNQVQKLGFHKEDVRHLIPTHLDNDHAGAVVDFLNATVHTSEPELKAALNPARFVEKSRYRQFQKPQNQKWVAHSFDQGEDWFGFKGVRPLPQTDDEILLIPLFGHTAGHFGVAIKSNGRWLFHVGDSYYHRSELTTDKSVAFKLFQKTVHVNFEKAMKNQQRLRELHSSHGHEIEIFSAHDPEEFALASR